MFVAVVREDKDVCVYLETKLCGKTDKERECCERRFRRGIQRVHGVMHNLGRFCRIDVPWVLRRCKGCASIQGGLE